MPSTRTRMQVPCLPPRFSRPCNTPVHSLIPRLLCCLSRPVSHAPSLAPSLSSCLRSCPVFSCPISVSLVLHLPLSCPVFHAPSESLVPRLSHPVSRACLLHVSGPMVEREIYRCPAN